MPRHNDPELNRALGLDDAGKIIARQPRVPSPTVGNGNGASAAPSHDWEDPDWSILDDRRGDLPEFPADVLTAPWQAWLKLAAHGAGVTPGHIAVPLLGTVSSLIGIARRVRASYGWSEPLTLWTCLVAASGDRKTPAMRVVLRALDMIEANNAASISAARLAHETRAQKAREANKRWKEARQTAIDAKPPQDPPPMPPEALDPGDFITPRLYSNDATIEKLAKLLLVRPRGLLQFRDELSGLFANMHRYSGGSDRPFWLEAWNGGRHVVERVKESVVVSHLLVGVLGSFQPDKLARAFAGDEDGMYGRFLFGWPSTPDYQQLSVEAREIEPELINALTRLIRLPAENSEGVFAPQDVWLSEEALAVFEVFRQFVDKEKRALDGREQQWFVKSETQVLRLAGTLAYMSWAMMPSDSGLAGITAGMEPTTIGEPFMTAAIRLVRDYFWPHAQASLRQIGLSDRHANARRVLRWLRANAKAEVSREEVRQYALGRRLDAAQTQTLLDELAKAGWLRLRVLPTKGRYAQRWEVNPSLYGTPESPQSPRSPSQDDNGQPATPFPDFPDFLDPLYGDGDDPDAWRGEP